MSKNIKPRNDNGQPHGLWESYRDNGSLNFKGNYVNGQRHGLCESYHSDGQLDCKGHYVKGMRHGYWESYYNSSGHVCYKGYYDMGKEVEYDVNVDTPSKEMFPIY